MKHKLDAVVSSPSTPQGATRGDTGKNGAHPSVEEADIVRARAKITRHYFTKIPSRILRRLSHSLAAGLSALAAALPKRKRTLSQVLEKYDQLAGEYIKSREASLAQPHEIVACLDGVPAKIGSDKYLAGFDSLIAENVFRLDPKAASYLELGVGEYTSAVGGWKRSGNSPPGRFVGMDLSWSRLQVGERYARSQGLPIELSVLGNIFQLPFLDNSFDVVYTVHCLEQSPFNTVQALREMYRVAGSYLILIEPDYELGDRIQKRRLILQDYVRDIPQAIATLGLNLRKHELCRFGSHMNCPAIYIIQKEPAHSGRMAAEFLGCPQDHGALVKAHGQWFNPRLKLVYPMIGGIACLQVENAIRASRFLDEL
ncbi:MAG: class I SAM-dependent methyltransferase [Verrucomicrobiota bacterium]